MINSIKAFIKTCPLLSDIDVNVNYLGENAETGAIENVSCEPTIKNYTDGGTLRQFLFTVALREKYGQAAAENTAATVKLEQLSDWIYEQDRLGILPDLDGNKNSVSLEVIKTGWVDEKQSNTAKYQLQCRLVYYQD